MDATKPWKCPDNYWDGIFTEYVLEHFSYKDAIFAIGECFSSGAGTEKGAGLLGKHVFYKILQNELF